MKIKKIHYLEIRKAVTACGKSYTELLSGDNPNHTSCKPCRRTHAWITAWEDRKEWQRERARPRTAVRRAIESGKLFRPDKCSLDEPLDEYHSLIFYDFLYDLWMNDESITVGHVMDILVQYYE